MCACLQAIHDGMNCKDYQDDLRVRAENDLAAQQTKQMLEVRSTSQLSVWSLGTRVGSCSLLHFWQEAAFLQISVVWVKRHVSLAPVQYPAHHKPQQDVVQGLESRRESLHTKSRQEMLKMSGSSYL